MLFWRKGVGSVFRNARFQIDTPLAEKDSRPRSVAALPPYETKTLPFWSAATRRRFSLLCEALYFRRHRNERGGSEIGRQGKFQSGDKSPHSKKVRRGYEYTLVRITIERDRCPQPPPFTSDIP
jgi:hypothetical protein